MNYHKLLSVSLVLLSAATQVCMGARGRPTLNSARTTFVADNGRALRGPYTSSEWGDPAPAAQIAQMKNLGFNAVHIYGECFDINYPNPGSTAPGYAASRIDSVVQATRDAGMYLVITIGNGANNGNYNRQYAIDFWKFYAPRYANETHVIYEIHNEPVAWGPPYSSSSATPPGALDMEIAVYNTIRQYAPSTPVLLFSYSVLGGTGGRDAALQDIRAFNQSVFGNQNATWNNIAVAFHGYAGAKDAATAVQGILSAGYPCLMTEFTTGTWGGTGGGLDVEGVANWERLGVSWLTFQYVPPWGVSDCVTNQAAYYNRVVNAGLSWTPDYGTFPISRGVYGNNGYPWTTPDYVNNTLSGTLRIQAEDFDNGGKNVAYNNGYSYNPGGQYRTSETVGVENTTDTGGGYDVGWTAANDWLEYTMKVPCAGTYDLRLRVAGTSAGQVQVLAGGGIVDLTGTWTLPNTGGWQTWTTVSKSVFLPPGQQKLRVKVLAGGFNLNWIELSPATSGPIANGTYKFQNVSNLLALDLNSDNNVVTVAPSSSTNQYWNLQHIGGGQYKVALASNGNAWNTWAGPLHLTWWWGAGGDQCFIILPASGGKYRVMPAGSGLALQPSSSSAPLLDQTVWTGSTAQQWVIATSLGFNGTYKLVARHSGKAMDAYGAQTTNGTQIIQWTYGGGANQRWTISLDGSAYKVIGVQSGKALEVSNGGTANGTRVQLWDYYGLNWQKFNITATDSGYYRFTPAHSTSSCLDVSGVSTADGANVQLWQWLGGNNQQWAPQTP